MAVLRCKMCGGTLTYEPGAVVCECEYCGSRQTLPNADSEKKANLFNRANRLRMNNEFDKASAVYESIAAEFPEEAEAYWGLCLCTYGIEYVDDPATGTKKPTCHRTMTSSIMEDENFEQACDNADAIARRVYREEAKAIDRIQKEILSIAANETPYDVFICYKETDEAGSRTEDSVLAQDIYDALTAKNLKVFFSRITLEDKLGVQYEPYIYAALSSARVMLAVGTQFEYFDAVWVKNEWSRFLGMMKTDKSKTLIPCFKGIDAYDMPKEFKGLQAQDMAKLGCLQDLVRGVEKLCGKSGTAQNTIVVQQVPSASGSNSESLLKRAFMFLEDGDWKSADEYCEKVLDIDPENAQAYLGKLMAELNVRTQGGLKDCPADFSGKNNYQKVMRFADDGLKKELESAIAYINERKETERKTDIYSSACKAMANAAIAENYEKEYEDAEKQFKSISGFKDADAKAKECKKLAEEKRNIEDKMLDAIIAALQDPESIGNQLQHLEDERNTLDTLFRCFAYTKEDYDRYFSQMQASEKGISELKAERATLGLFDVKRKKDINTKIAEMQTKLTSIQEALAQRKTDLMGYSSKQAVKVRLDELDEDIKKKKALCGSAIIYSAEDAINQMRKSRRLLIAAYAKNPEVVWRAAQKGFIVKFGAYMQSSDSTAKTPIEWLVLENTGSRMLLISKYALACKRYNEKLQDVTWRTCTLRKWLNESFINEAFNAEEKSIILETTVTADRNPRYRTYPGNDTTDKIFLLSIDEAKEYFNSDAERMCAPTAYAKTQGACTNDSRKVDGEATCWWWLRSPGNYQGRTADVNIDGGVNSYGGDVRYDYECVRPAFWINLDS